MESKNSFNTKSDLAINGKNYIYFDLKVLSKKFNFDLNQVPFSLKILLENVIRNEDGELITKNTNKCLKINFVHLGQSL